LEIIDLNVVDDTTAGTFHISMGGVYSGDITYTSDRTLMAQRIDAALEGMSNLGVDNIEVIYSAGLSNDNVAAFELRYVGSLAKMDIANITSHFGNLSLATVKPFSSEQGLSQVAQVQQISINSADKAQSFTLMVSHNGENYTTSVLDNNASLADIQAAINTAINLPEQVVTLVFFNGSVMQLSFGGDWIGENVADVQLTLQEKVAVVALETEVEGFTHVKEALPERELVVDFSDATNMSVKSSADTEYTLDMSGELGRLLEVRADVEIDVAGFVGLSGTFAFTKADQGETEQLQVLGENIDAYLEVDSAYVRLNDADFGLLLDTEGQLAFELKNGSFAAGIEGLAGISADEVIVQYTNATTTIAQDTSINIFDLEYTFETAIAANTIAFGVKGFSANISDFVSLEGDFGFKKVDTNIVVVGNNVDAVLQANEDNYVRLNDASFGLITGAGATVFELSQGSFAASIAGMELLSAQEVIVQYTNATGLVAANTTIGVGSIQYNFGQAITANTVAFGVKGFSANVSGFASLEGDLGFKKAGSDIIAIGNNVSAKLDAGTVANVSLTNANFGLIMSGNETAFELSEGAFSANIASLAAISAESVFVQYTSATTTIAAGRILSIGSLEYTFDEAIAANTVAFAVKGFNANVADFVTLSGDLGFKKSGSSMVAVGNNVNASLGVDGVAELALTGANFGLLIDGTEMAFELTQGALSAQIDGFDLLPFESVAVQFTNSTTSITKGRSLSVGDVDYSFSQDIAADTVAFAVYGFNVNLANNVVLEGDFGFAKIGAELFAVGNDVTAGLDVGAAYVRLEDADTAVIWNEDGYVLETKNGQFSAGIEYLADVSADSAFLQYSHGAINVAAHRVVNLGGVSYTFDNAISGTVDEVGVAFDVKNLQANIFDVVEISGDIGFFTDNGDLVANAVDFDMSFSLGDDFTASITDANFDLRYGQQLKFDIEGDLTLSAFDFIDFTYHIDLSQEFFNVTLDDGSTTSVALMTFAEEGIDFFAGANGVGFEIEDAAFGLGVAIALTDPNQFWISAKATTSAIGFVGVDILEVSAEEMEVVINTSSENGRSIDYSVAPITLTSGLGVKVGDLTANTGTDTNILFDMKGETIKVAGDLSVDLLGVMAVEGRFAFEKSIQNITLESGVSTSVNAMTFTAEDATGFVGFGYKTDDEFGFKAQGIDFGLGMFIDRNDASRQWTMMQGNVDTFDFVGVDDIKLNATDLNLSYYKLPVDLVGIDLEISEIDFGSLDLDFNPGELSIGKGSIFSFSGNFDIDAFGLLQAIDDFEMVLEFDTLVLSDGTVEDVTYFTFAYTDLDIFAGAGTREDGIGLAVDDLDFAMALVFSPFSSEYWVTVQGSTEFAGMVGVPGVSLEVQQAKLLINTADSQGRVIDYSAKNLVVPTGIGGNYGGLEGNVGGNGDSVTLDLDGSQGAVLRVDLAGALLAIDNFVHLSGDVSFVMGTKDDLVIEGSGLGAGVKETSKFNYISVIGSNLNAFVGMGSPYFGTGETDAVGLYASDVDFAFVNFRNDDYKLQTLQLDIEEAGLVGMEGVLEATLSGVTVALNSGKETAGIATPYVNYKESFGDDGMILSTLGGDSVALKFEDKLEIAARVENAHINMAGFLELDGSLAFSKGTTYELVAVDTGALADFGAPETIIHDIEVMTIGGSNLTGFAGVGGSTDGVGLKLDSTTFGVAVMKASGFAGLSLPQQVKDNMPTYFAAKATIESAELIGMDSILEARVEGVEININTSMTTLIPANAALFLPMPHVDFQHIINTNPITGNWDEQGLKIDTGDDDNPVYLDFGDEIIQAKVEYFQGDLAGVMQVAGSMAFTKRGSETVTLSNGDTRTVTSLSLGMTDVYGFVGVGGYWEENSLTNKIDGSVTNSDAFGLAVEDLDVGAVFMLDTNPQDPATYFAADVNLAKAGLVGIEGITAELSQAMLDLNQTVSGDGAVVDFSKSTYQLTEDGPTQAGYLIETGDIEKPIILDFSERVLRVQGEAEFNAFDLMQLDGVFEIKLTDEEFNLFVDASAHIGPDGFGLDVTKAQVLFVANSAGVAARALLEEANIDLGAVAQLNVEKMELILNTTGETIVYEVPEEFQARIGDETIAISNIPPGKTDAQDFYLSLEGLGNLDLLSGALKMDGGFSILLSTDRTEVSVNMTLEHVLLEPISVAGTLGFATGANAGLYGGLQVGAPGGSLIIGNDDFGISAFAMLQINTTTASQSVRALKLDSDGNVISGEYENVDIDASTLRISGSGEINIAGAVSLEGRVDLLVDSTGIQAALDMKLDLGDFGELEFEGAAAITEDRFALRAATSVELGIAAIGINAAAILEINTGSDDYTTLHGDVIKGNTTFNLQLGGADRNNDGDITDADEVGKIKILAFEIDFQGGISIVDDVFEIRIDKAGLDFFGVLDVEISGYLRSNGEFEVTGSARLYVDMEVLILDAGISMTFSDKLFAASVYGSLDINLDMGFFEINETLAGFSGEIELTASSASLAAEVTIAGISISAGTSWSWGNPPVITTQINDVLYLNMGDVADRYGDSGGDLYGDIYHESYRIESLYDEDPDSGIITYRPGQVKVSALGEDKVHTGVNKIIAFGGKGNDSIFVGQGVDALLHFDGGEGNDTFIILGGASGSTILGGKGNDSFVSGDVNGLSYLGGTGNDDYRGGAGSASINMGTGKNTIIAGSGNDVIRVEGSVKTELTLTGGDNLITADLSGLLDIKGGSGYDRVLLDSITSTDILQLKDSAFIYKDRQISFNNELDKVEVTDLSSSTIMRSDAGYSWGATGLKLTASGLLDVTDAELIAPTGHFNIKAAGINGVLNTTLAQFTLVNTGVGVNADVVIRETDNLVILDGERGSKGGIYTANGGLIDIELAGREALLDLQTGVIEAFGGGDIRLITDDADFRAGTNSVRGTGNLLLRAQDTQQNYNFGGAGQSTYGRDFSVSGNSGAMELGMGDLGALRNGFNLLEIGHQAAGVVMYIGDVEDAIVGSFNFSARFNDEAKLYADRINIVGDVQSTQSLTFNGRLMEVLRNNLHDPMGSPDSGVSALETYINLSEQLVITGWIKGENLVQIDVDGSTGENVMVSYGEEANSITADKASVVMTSADNSRVVMNASASIISAAGIYVEGSGSSINVDAGTGMVLLEGAALTAEGNSTSMTLRSDKYFHVYSGASIVVGAEKVNNNWIISGTNTQLNIDTQGELRLGDLIVTAGEMNLNYGETFNDYASYFDTISGKTLATDNNSNDVIINALKAGAISVELAAVLANNNLTLGNGASVTSLANFTPFDKLSAEAKLQVATSLGYTFYEEGLFYNPTENQIFSDINIGTVAQAQQTAYAENLDYQKFNGTYFFNDTSGSLKSTLVEGESADYSNQQIDWALYGATTPNASASFASLTQPQKEAVAKSLGYSIEPTFEFTRIIATGEADDNRSTFGAYYFDADAVWGDDGVPTSNATLSELTINQKIDASKYLSYFPEYDVNEFDWGILDTPDSDSSFENLTIAQKEIVANDLGFTSTITGYYFTNLGASDPDKRIVTEFEQGVVTDYQNQNIYWGNVATPSASANFASLSSEQQGMVAASLGYQVYTGTNYYKADAVIGEQMKLGFVVGNQVDYNLIDWGGAGQPEEEFSSFEQLSFEQRQFVAESLEYSLYEHQVFYNANADTENDEEKIRIAFTEGSAGDYEIGDIVWGEVPEAAASKAWSELSNQQQDLILAHLGYVRFNGQVWNKDADFKLTFVQGEISKDKELDEDTGQEIGEYIYELVKKDGSDTFDYRNSEMLWTVVEIPELTESGTEPLFTDLTADQQFRVLEALDLEWYANASYYNATPDTAVYQEHVMSGFTVDLHYQNDTINIPTSDLQENRWLISDGTNRYLAYAYDSTFDGVIEEIRIQQPHELVGQRGYGFLLTGTLITLADEQGIEVTGENDIIVRGDIDLRGANSDLTLQSDTWVYWEGNASVSGNITIKGGVALDGTPIGVSGGANSKGVSLFVHETSKLSTQSTASSILLHAGQDAIINGTVTAGGVSSDEGVTWLGDGDSEVSVIAGQRIYVDSGIAASKLVSLTTTSIAGAGDDVSIKITSAGGLTAGGITSDNSGGTVVIDAKGHVELVGAVIAGGQTVFTDDGPKIIWSDEDSKVSLKASGQLYLGGEALKESGGTVEIGASIRANQLIQLEGGAGRNGDGIGIRMLGGTKVATSNAAGEIQIKSADDAELFGLIVSGGEILDHYGSRGLSLGSTRSYSDGASTISIEATEGQVRLGRDLYAGSLIDVRGGVSAKAAVTNYTDQGIVIFGSSNLKTGLENSTINLSSAGNLTVLATPWSNEIFADGFVEFADGDLSADVVLSLTVDLGTHKVSAQVTIPKSATLDNEGASSLAENIKTALYATDFTVIESLTGSPALDSKQKLTDEQLQIRLEDGRFKLTSFFEFNLNHSSSIGLDRLGFSQAINEDVSSYGSYAIDASAKGSIVNLGKAGAIGGKVNINNHVVGYDAINFLSGSTGGGLNLQSLGTLETRSGNIELNPVGDSVLEGSLIAAGRDADIIINASRSIEVRGDLTADRDIIINAGTGIEAGVTSIYTHSSSVLQSTGDSGRILITGLNDVTINSNIGHDNPGLSEVTIIAESGTLTLAKEAGNIETASQLSLKGQNLVIEGVLKSLNATDSLTDYEVTMQASQDASISGDFHLAGSLLIKAGQDVSIFNTDMTADEDGQRLTVQAGRDILLGNTDPTAGDSQSYGAIIEADSLIEMMASGQIILGADAQLYTEIDNSKIKLKASTLQLVGSARAGADYNFETNTFAWMGKDAILELRSDKATYIGGKGLDLTNEYALIDSGGYLAATGQVQLRAGKDASGIGVSLTQESSITANANLVDLTVRGDSSIQINATGQLQLNGVIRAEAKKVIGDSDDIAAKANITLSSNSLIAVDNLIHADDQLTVLGGTHSSKVGVWLKNIVLDGTDFVSGGALETAEGGDISITANEGIFIQGQVGKRFADPDDVSLFNEVTGTAVIHSSSGNVNLVGAVAVKDDIQLSGGQVNILAGGYAYATSEQSKVFIQARDAISLSAAASAEPPENIPAIVKGDALVHLSAPLVSIAGIVEVTDEEGLLLLNAGSQLSITGWVISEGDIRLQAGVNTQSTREVLETEIDQEGLKGLSDGLIQVLSSGTIKATGNVTINTGGEFKVQADALLSNDLDLKRPVIEVISEEIEIVTGSREVAIGTILVPVISWVDTSTIEQIGEEKVKVGNEVVSMSVTLQQLGYYNPNADAGMEFREFFIEGLHYVNEQEGEGDIPGVDWNNAGVKSNPALVNRTAESVTGDYKSDDYRTFSQLNDAQKQAVLNRLGYMPLFQMEHSNLRLSGSYNGTPFTVAAKGEIATAQDVDIWADAVGEVSTGLLPWTTLEKPAIWEGPDWASLANEDNQQNYLIDVDGWKDKYVQMPEGAQADLLRIVSSGVAKYLSSDDNMEGSSEGGVWQTAAVSGGLKFERTDGVNGLVSDFTSGFTSYNVKTYSQAYDELDWNKYSEDEPDSQIQFSALTSAQKIVVAEYLGYTQASMITSESNIGEWVGTYQDNADVSYTQQGSRFTQTQLDALSTDYNDVSDENQYLDAYWEASYVGTTGLSNAAHSTDTGDRVFTMSPTDQGGTLKYDPKWVWTPLKPLLNDVPLAIDAAFTDNTPDAPAATWYKDGISQGTISTEFTKKVKADSQYFDVLAFDTESLTQKSEIEPREDEKAGGFDYWTSWNYEGLGYVNSYTYADWSWQDDRKTRSGWDRVKTLIKQHTDVETKSWTSDEGWSERDNQNSKVRYRDKISVTVKEDFKDYVYEWQSEDHKIYDQRIQLEYNLTYQSEDIFDYRDVYAQIDQRLMVTTLESQTVWETQEIIDTQTITRTVVGEESIFGTGGDFSNNSIEGINITVNAGGKSNVSGLLNATNNLTINSSDDLTVVGILSDGATIASQAKLVAGNELSLHSDNNLVLADSSFLSAATIDLNAKASMTIQGEVGTEASAGINTLSVEATAGGEIALNAAIIADDLINLAAGQSTSKDGGISTSLPANIMTTEDNSEIQLTAGIYGGHISLDQSALTAGGALSTVTISAVEGRFEQTQGLITAHKLSVTADNALTANTRVNELDLTLLGSGDIAVVNQGDLILNSVTAADGAISIDNWGALTVTDVQAMGTSDRNDINLTTFNASAGSTADIKIALLKTTERGDININAQGTVLRISDSISNTSTTTQAAKNQAQISKISFSSSYQPIAETSLSVIVAGTFETVAVGDTVNGSVVTADWTSLLNALSYTLTQTASIVTATIDLSAREISVTGVDNSTFSFAGPDAIVADQLIIEAMAPIILNTQVNAVSIKTTLPGDVTLEQDSRSLRVFDTQILDGNFVLNAGATVTVDSLILSSNKAASDVTITAEDNIAVNSLVAGVYLDTADKRFIADGSTDEISTTTEAGSKQAQISKISFSQLYLPVAETSLSVNVNEIPITVAVGDTVNGLVVTADWTSLLNALGHSLTQSSSIVSATIDLSAREISITGLDNTAFTLIGDGSTEEISTLTQAGSDQAQMSHISFNGSFDLVADTSLSVMVAGESITVAVGETVNGSVVTADWTSLLNALGSTLEQTASIVTATVDVSTQKISVTGVENTAFSFEYSHVNDIELTSVASAGIVTLISTTGAVIEGSADAGVDIVAQRLNISADKGILGLEVALNVLDAQTTSGDIQLTELDGYFEKTTGLQVLNAKTALDGTSRVEIIAENNLLVMGTALVQGDYVRLESQEGNIQVINPESSDFGIKHSKGNGFSAVDGSVDL
ncbi:MAG: calcium-binding protein, partial [Oceanospirillaceae bacterium]